MLPRVECCSVVLASFRVCHQELQFAWNILCDLSIDCWFLDQQSTLCDMSGVTWCSSPPMHVRLELLETHLHSKQTHETWTALWGTTAYATWHWCATWSVGCFCNSCAHKLAMMQYPGALTALEHQLTACRIHPAGVQLGTPCYRPRVTQCLRDATAPQAALRALQQGCGESTVLM